MLSCSISYMPYRTGDYPAGFQGETVDSLASLCQAAEAGLAQEQIPIRIVEPALLVDDMNRILQQVGGRIPVVPVEPGWDGCYGYSAGRIDPGGGCGTVGRD